MICSSQGAKLRYVSHRLDGDKLVVTQRSDNLQAVTTFTFGAYDGYAVQTAYTNIGNETLTLEETSAFVFGGFAAVRNSEKRRCTPLTKAITMSANPLQILLPRSALPMILLTVNIA